MHTVNPVGPCQSLIERNTPLPSDVVKLVLEFLYFPKYEYFQKHWDPKLGLDPERFSQVFFGDAFRTCGFSQKKLPIYPATFFLEILKDRAKSPREGQVLLNIEQTRLCVGECSGFLLHVQEVEGQYALDVYDQRSYKVNPLTHAPYEGHYLKFPKDELIKKVHLSHDGQKLVVVSRSVSVFSRDNPSTNVVIPANLSVLDAYLVDKQIFAFYMEPKFGVCVQSCEIDDKGNVVLKRKTVVSKFETNGNCFWHGRCFFQRVTSTLYYAAQEGDQNKEGPSTWYLRSFNCLTFESTVLKEVKYITRVVIDSLHVQGSLMAYSYRAFPLDKPPQTHFSIYHLATGRFVVNFFVTETDPVYVQFYGDTLYGFSEKGDFNFFKWTAKLPEAPAKKALK